MNRSIIVVLLLAFSCGQKNQDQEEFIRPDWEIGDYRFYNEVGTTFVRVKSDTIFTSKFDKTLKLTVLEKTNNFYVIQVEKVSTSDVNLSTAIDSLKDVERKLTKTIDVLQSLTKYYKPFKVRINLNGDVEEIVDFDEYYNTLVEDIAGLRDSIKIDDEQRQTLLKLMPENETIKEQLRANLYKQISDVFDIYNIKNPLTKDIHENFSAPNPTTGELLSGVMTYHTASVKKDIQEIELKIDFDEPLQDLLAKDSSGIRDNAKSKSRDMASASKFLFNTKTHWLEYFDQNVSFSNDSMEYRQKMISKLYK